MPGATRVGAVAPGRTSVGAMEIIRVVVFLPESSLGCGAAGAELSG
jgi:hypothetical protein